MQGWVLLPSSNLFTVCKWSQQVGANRYSAEEDTWFRHPFPPLPASHPIFLPSDNWFDWVLAKIYYRSADAQVVTCTYICITFILLYIHIANCQATSMFV